MQKLVAEFPIGTTFGMKGKLWYLLGYTESDELIVTTTNPADNWEEANDIKEYLHAQCVREAMTK